MADVVENDAALLKLIKKLPTGFQEECDSYNEKQLRDCIVESTHNLQTAVDELKSKEEYKKLRTQWKELNEPIRDIKAAQKSKVSYCLHRLEQLGKL
jgi:predicted component of type VI protein secretion system